MSRCGSAFNLNSIGEERELSVELQSIIQQYHLNFDGEPVMVNDDLEG